jgi:hypothetical protein
MSKAPSILAVVLGSAVISSGMSIAYQHFNSPKADRDARTVQFINVLSAVLRDQKETDEFGRLVFITDVLFPLYGEDEQFSGIVLKMMEVSEVTPTEDDADVVQGSTLERVLTRDPSQIANSEVVQALVDEGKLLEIYDVDQLRDTFFGGYRLQASDQLIERIEQGDAETVSLLISSIVRNDARREYRVNLYIAFTLARTTSWTGSAADLEAIQGLVNTPNYRDPTFKQHVDNAIARFSAS